MRLENVKTITENNLLEKVQKKQKRKNTKIRFYHSFFTIILILCVFQIGSSALLNLSKIVVYQAKINKSEKLKAEALEVNKKLKTELNGFNSMQRVESIARNNLKMAAEDEVLIIINNSNTEPAQELILNKKKSWLGFFEKFEDKFARKYDESR